MVSEDKKIAASWVGQELKGTEDNFRGDRNVLYVIWGVGYVYVYMY